MACLNCGKDLNKEGFCPDCGQKNTDRDISIRSLISDFLGDYFSFDSKLFRTLVPLLTKPGLVPLEFMEGKRVKHIPPLRSLIFSSFIYFLLFGAIMTDPSAEMEDLKEVDTQINENLENGDSKGEINIGGGLFNMDLNGIDSTNREGPIGKMNQIRLAVEAGIDATSAVDSIANDNEGLERRFFLQWAKLHESSPEQFVQFMVGNFSIMLLIIQPFLAFILWLLYIRHRKRWHYVRHLVHSLYTHTWMMVIGSVFIPFSLLFESEYLRLILVIISAFYITLSLKRFYGQSWRKTILKSVLVFLAYIGFLFPLFFLVSIGFSFLFF